MSDIGRYRRLYTRLWRHPGFMALSEGEKVVALYLLTGPQGNRLGLFVLSVATAAEDLGTTPETLAKRLVRVCQTFGWSFDKPSRVFYIPSWFKWNRPENENVMKGSLKDLNEIPPSGLIDAFARNIETIPQTLHETFIEGLRQRLPNGLPTQEQYQDQKSGAGAGHARAEKVKPSLTEHQPTSGHLVEIARRTLKITNPNQSIEALVDAFQCTIRHESPSASCARAEAVAALNVALAEQRRA